MAKLKASTKTKPGADAKRLPPRQKTVVVQPLPVPVGTPLDNLTQAIEEVRAGKRVSVRTSKLLASGIPKMAQKVVEEAAETAIEAVRGQRKALIDESVDLIYNLLVLLAASGVPMQEIWDEMNRRAATLGMAEKLPKIGEEL